MEILSRWTGWNILWRSNFNTPLTLGAVTPSSGTRALLQAYKRDAPALKFSPTRARWAFVANPAGTREEYIRGAVKFIAHKHFKIRGEGTTFKRLNCFVLKLEAAWCCSSITCWHCTCCTWTANAKRTKTPHSSIGCKTLVGAGKMKMKPTERVVVMQWEGITFPGTIAKRCNESIKQLFLMKIHPLNKERWSNLVHQIEIGIVLQQAWWYFQCRLAQRKSCFWANFVRFMSFFTFSYSLFYTTKFMILPNGLYRFTFLFFLILIFFCFHLFSLLWFYKSFFSFLFRFLFFPVCCSLFIIYK